MTGYDKKIGQTLEDFKKLGMFTENTKYSGQCKHGRPISDDCLQCKLDKDIDKILLIDKLEKEVNELKQANTELQQRLETQYQEYAYKEGVLILDNKQLQAEVDRLNGIINETLQGFLDNGLSLSYKCLLNKVKKQADKGV